MVYFIFAHSGSFRCINLLEYSADLILVKLTNKWGVRSSIPFLKSDADIERQQSGINRTSLEI